MRVRTTQKHLFYGSISLPPQHLVRMGDFTSARRSNAQTFGRQLLPHLHFIYMRARKVGRSEQSTPKRDFRPHFAISALTDFSLRGYLTLV